MARPRRQKQGDTAHEGEPQGAARRGMARLRQPEAECACARCADLERQLALCRRITGIFLTVPGDGIYAAVLQVVLEATASPYGFFGYVADNGDLVVPSLTGALWDECRIADKTYRFPLTGRTAIWARSLETGKPIIRNDGCRVPVGHLPLRRAMVVPIVHDGRVIGQFAVADRDGDYGTGDLTALQGIADMTAPVLEARLAHDRQEQQRLVAAAELERERDLTVHVMETSPTGILVIDREERITFANATAEQVLRLKSTGNPPGDSRAPIDAAGGDRISWESGGSPLRRVLQEGAAVRDVRRTIRRSDGSQVTLSVSAAPLLDGAGVVTGAVARVENVSEAVRAEETLRRSERRYREALTIAHSLLHLSLRDLTEKQLAEQGLAVLLSASSLAPGARGGVYLLDGETLVLQAHRGLPATVERRCGCVALGECLCGRAAATRQVQFTRRSGTPATVHLGTPAGGSHYAVPIVSGDQALGVILLTLPSSGRRDRAVEQFVCWFADVMAEIIVRRRAEEGERRLQSRYQKLVEEVDAIVWEADPETWQFTFVSPKAEAVLGYPPDMWLSQPAFWAEHIHPDDRQATLAECRRATSELEDHELVYRMVAADGTAVWLRDIVAVEAADGRPTLLRGIMVDITAVKQTEEALRHSMELLERVFAAVNVLIAYMDRDFRFIRVNRAYAEVDGRDPGFFVGKNHFELYPSAENRAIFRRVVETGEPYVASAKPFVYTDHPERGVTYWNWVLQPVMGEGGRVIELLFTLVDVTERVRAEAAIRRHGESLEQLVQERTADLAEAVERLRAEVVERARAEDELRESQVLLERTFAGLREAVLIVGAEGRAIVDCNPAATTMFGYGREELLGRQTAMLHVDQAALEEFRGLLERAVAEKGFLSLAEFRMKRKSGEVFPTEHTVMPLEDQAGKTIGWVSVVRDITERKMVEQLKSDFIANVSHELRAPLASVLGYTGVLLEGAPGPLTPVQQDFLGVVYGSGQRLRLLVNDLLDASGLESGQFAMSFAAISPADLIRAAVQAIAPSSTEKGVEVHSLVEPGLPDLQGDSRRLGQVLDNLLSNAVRYTPAGGRVSISASTGAAGHLIIEVRDTGPGIPAEDLPHVFERFRRGANAVVGGGTGLGLYIARAIVEAHGGRIEAESREGNGAVFRIHIPMRPVRPGRQTEP